MAAQTSRLLAPALLAFMALASAPDTAQSQELGPPSLGPVAPLAATFSPQSQIQEPIDPLTAWAIGPLIAFNLEHSAFRLGLAAEFVLNPASLSQVLSLSANVGRLATEFRNFLTASLLAGVVLGEGPVFQTIHPRFRAGLVADRSTFKTGMADARTEVGLALAAGMMYGFTKSVVGGADLTFERVAGLNQLVLSINLLLGPLGAFATGS